MTNLTKANEARADKALNKLFRFEEGVMSFKQRIELGYYSDSKAMIMPTMQWNRTKFNRMTSDKEQKAYEAKIEASRKTCYSLIHTNDVRLTSDVSRFVYEYFLEYMDNKHYEENKEQYATDEELEGLFNN